MTPPNPRTLQARSLTLSALSLVLLTPGVVLAAGPDLFQEGLARGPFYAALTAFLGGLLVCLTPCVYPMVAITVSVFGARGDSSRRQAMALSSAFVLGIAAMFTPLGLIAGLTGSLFGSALANPWVTTFIALVFLGLAASMFGAFEFMLPSGVTNRLARVGGAGYGGAFLIGLVSGLVAAPCTGPVLTGILLWIGKTRSAALGSLVLFAFSIGLGIPFWLVGTFAVRLPRAGRWMLWTKSFFGVVLGVLALYFLQNALRPLASLSHWGGSRPSFAAALLVAGVLLGAIHLSFDAGHITRFRKAAGVVSSIGGALMLVAWLEAPPAQLRWERSEATATQRAASEAKPLLLDFTAEWCGACKELARHTFADPTVMQEASRFVAVQVDATSDDDPAIDELKDKYGVVGLPTVILLGANGQERARITEFVPPEQFSSMLRSVN
ncbi:MAG TPA: cytochrome c biogenesis protein CcdA [Polyangiaceae bacterium]|nr:cytochrome c biogenesis protein CcdA [Polyangiaceae bacterium]